MDGSDKLSSNSAAITGNPSNSSSLSYNRVQYKAIKPGDHLCLVYETPLEWRESIASYITSGLEQNQKVIYVTDCHTKKDVFDCLNGDGNNLEAYISNNQFEIIDQRDIYTKGGHFDPERVIRMIADGIREALKQGYSALRATGEMSWALKNVRGTENLCKYEARLNQLFKKYPSIVLCQYDLNLFDAGLIQEILKTHPKVIHKNIIHYNYFYIPPDEYLDEVKPAREDKYWLKNLEAMTEQQAQIQASEDKYRTLFETAGMPLCMLDDKGVIALANNYFEKVLGYSKQAIEGKMPFAQLVHPDEVDRLQSYFNLRVISPNGTPEEYKTRIINKRGDTRHAIFNVRMIPDTGNRIVSALDITEIVNAEHELKKAHAKYKTLFTNAPVAICEMDFSKVRIIFDGIRKEGISDLRHYFESRPDIVDECIAKCTLIEFNQATMDIYGTTNRDLIVSLVNESVGNKTEFRHLFSDVIFCLAGGKTQFTKEYNIQTVNGRQKTVVMVMTVAPKFEKELSVVYFCFHDITALKEAEGRYRALVDLSGEIGESIVMLTDFNNQEAAIAFTSTQFTRVTGYKKHELLGKPFIDFLLPEDREGTLYRHRKKMRGGSIPGLFEMNLVSKNGKIIPIELTSAVTNYQGRPVNVCYLRDVTERKLREQNLIESGRRFKSLSNKIIQHQEAERVKLSRELHDQFGQELVSLRLRILDLQKQCHAASNCSRINQMLDSVDLLVEMTRSLASDLRPGILDKLGLVSTLQWYSQKFEKQTGILCKVVIKNPSLNVLKIPPDTAIVAYRITQEALANVIQHSQATIVNIILNIRHGNLAVKIEDNGIGAKFNKQKTQSSLGIMGMQERASIIGGEIEIITQAKKGFKLRVYLPLEQPSQGV